MLNNIQKQAKGGRKDVETHLFVGVDAVDDDVKELARLRLELVRFSRRGRGGGGEGAAMLVLLLVLIALLQQQGYGL